MKDNLNTACGVPPGRRCQRCQSFRPKGWADEDIVAASLAASGRWLPAERVPSAFADVGARVVPKAEAILGWRLWVVRVSRGTPWLLAPYGQGITKAARRWRPGVNKASTAYCWAADCRNSAHPSPMCDCGFRAMSSLASLLTFYDSQKEHVGPLAALAQVEMWGNVVGPWAPGMDWQRTLRASRARIHGARFVADRSLRKRLGRHYRVSTVPWPS